MQNSIEVNNFCLVNVQNVFHALLDNILYEIETSFKHLGLFLVKLTYCLIRNFSSSKFFLINSAF